MTRIGSLSLRQLSMLTGPPDAWIMAALRAYLDDSGDCFTPSLVVAGYIGSVRAWDRFNSEWNAVLKRHDIPYFHMKEIPDPRSPMHRFYGKNCYGDLAALLGDLSRAIGVASSVGPFGGIGGLVPRDALDRFNRERNRNLEPLPLALFTCVGLIQTIYKDRIVEALLDCVTKAERQIAIAKDYLATSPKVGGIDTVVIIPAKGGINAKSVNALQAADFAAYECFRQFERLDPFFKSVDFSDIQSNMEYWYKYEMWLQRNQRPSPDRRKSLSAIADATAFRCPIWTYEVLCSEDDARSGTWRD